MPNLFIMRHGDAAGHRAGDRERTLTSAGQAQAKEAGRDLAALDSPPRQILCSSAPRAFETAKIVAEVLGRATSMGAPAFYSEDRLYLASAQTMLDSAAAALAASEEDLLLVAHEPGCGELVALLCEGQTNLSIYPFRTAGIRRLELPGEAVLIPGSARLTLEI